MVVNKICIICKGRNTYYKGKGIFYCKDCKKEFEFKALEKEVKALNC